MDIKLGTLKIKEIFIGSSKKAKYIIINDNEKHFNIGMPEILLGNKSFIVFDTVAEADSLDVYIDDVFVDNYKLHSEEE